jgi:hypothetical protein
MGSSGGANGHGTTREEAVADHRAAVRMVLAEDRIPDELRNWLTFEFTGRGSP